MKTRLQIHNILQDFANNHLQINRFGYGEAFERNPKEGTYPLLWVVPLPYNIIVNDCDYAYRLVVLDRVRKDESDELEVESDTDKILKDSLSYLWKYCQQNDLELIENFTFTPTYEQDNDEVTGFYTDVTIRDTFDYSSCALPLVDTIPSDEYPNQQVYNDSNLKDKSFTILSPQSGDTASWYTSKSISIREIAEALEGTSGQLTYNIFFASSKNSGSPTKVWTSNRTASSESGTTTQTFDNRIIPANNWVWVEVISKSGVVNEIFLTIFYKYNI